MIKSITLSTYTKIIISITLTSIGFVLLFSSLYYYTLQQEKQVYKSSKEQFSNEVNSLLLLNSESKLSTITDITFWDELVDFVKSKNEKWFEESIYPMIKLYKLDYVVIYDLQAKLVKNASTNKIKTEEFIPKEAIQKLHKNKLSKFYMRLPEGIVEVYGATIHPSSDPSKSKTKPSGYFFIANFLDESYFDKLEKISSSKISFAKNSTDLDEKTILIFENLFDYKGEVIEKLSFKRNFNVNFQSAKNTLHIIFIAFLVLVVLNFYFSEKWIHKPLGLIKRVLETENRKAIKLLKGSSVEFGYIAKLVEESIKQRKQLEISKNKAEENDKLKSAFLTNLSHEIRTPMNAIIGFSDLLKESNINEKERLEYLSVIEQSGSNLVLIIDDLVEMSKIDANQIKPNYTSINVDSCIKELYNTIKITIPKDKKINFNLVNTGKLVEKNIITDVIKLKQVLINLITNAIKFTETGFVSLDYKIDKSNSTILFTVQDTGSGIDAAHQEVIFDRFRKLEANHVTKASGLGLGLAISKAYVEMLGGTISIHSKLGEGSIFVVVIPIILDESEVKKAVNNINLQHNEGNKNGTILIAEDDNINFLLLEKIMQLKKHKIIRAKNGLEAVEFCKNNPEIDLVLMDIKMPILNGYDALAKIKIFRPELPIIAQTAYCSTEEREKMKQVGFTNTITKPINKEKLFEIIDKLLA